MFKPFDIVETRYSHSVPELGIVVCLDGPDRVWAVFKSHIIPISILNEELKMVCAFR